jgi:hypothetical protein
VSGVRELGIGRRVAGYVASAIVASVVYVVWLTVWEAVWGGGTAQRDWGFEFRFSLFFWIAGGFALALLLMIVPWATAVWVWVRTRWDARFYFPIVGAVLVFVIGCVASSISPKPLFVEDQTFLQGVVMTAQRQGICLAVCGVVFGVCYAWFERRKGDVV